MAGLDVYITGVIPSSEASYRNGSGFMHYINIIVPDTVIDQILSTAYSCDRVAYSISGYDVTNSTTNVYNYDVAIMHETQVSGHLGMSGGRSPRHAQNP